MAHHTAEKVDFDIQELGIVDSVGLKAAVDAAVAQVNIAGTAG